MANTNKINLYCILSVLFLISSPCLSLVYLATGFFLSNEKIAALIAIIYWIIFERKFGKNIIFISIFLFITLLLANVLRSTLTDDIFHDIDISYLIWFLTFPFYVSLFSKNYVNNRIAFKFILLIQATFFIVELIVKYYNLFPIESYLIINPVQGEYIYPEITNGFFRVSGLFNESSQIAIFFCLMYYYFRKNIYSFLLIPLILATVSMTGYLMLLSLIIFNRISKSFILFAFIIGSLFYLFVDGVSGSIDYRLELFKNMDDPRIIALIDNYMKFLERPLLGLGSSMADAQRWDIFSVYIYPYGLFFGSVIVFTIIYFLYYFNVLFFYWPVIFTNITLQNSINLILILICVTIFNERKTK